MVQFGCFPAILGRIICVRPEMALFPLSGVLLVLSDCNVQQYVSPETLIDPCSTKKMLISESDTFFAHMVIIDVL